jgi:hypothetical protein
LTLLCADIPLGGAAVTPAKHRTITAADRAFWSFQPIQHPAEPAVRDNGWCRNAIDHFILAKLEAEGLTPAPEADRQTLIRRATFDLTGLPPSPQEVNSFIRDSSSDAYEKLIDRLLASPRYGERWGRHWLDLVRYAESDGFRQDAYRPTAWLYRDYVIRSLNQDKPYDRFVREQLAGDELWPGDPDALVATGYLRHSQYEYNNRDVPVQWAQMLTDVTDVTGDVFLGLSMGCCRCHDHKFDPILQSDYFRLQAFFAPMLPRNDLPIATNREKEEYAIALETWEKKTGEIRAKMEAIEKVSAEGAAKAAFKKFPDEMQAILLKPAGERSPLETQLATLAYRQIADPSDGTPPKISAKEKDSYGALRAELSAYDSLKPKPLQHGQVTTDVGPIAPLTFVPGHPDQPLQPGAPVVLEDPAGRKMSITPTATSTGRRTALAAWITQPGNPLASRVMVNRIWQFHFGRGLVTTSSDFGHLGAPPSHPELLDWLATKFVDGGWSLKQVHRLIMTSATYRQAALSPAPEVAKIKDPEDRWLWRMSTQRLDAEQIRDSMLAASGELQLDAGGASAETTSPRRAIYTKAVRNTHDPVLEAFDVAEAFTSVCLRNVTTTPTQSLLMINGDWPLKRAAAMAARVRREATSSDPAALVDAAYRLAYARPPQPDEQKGAIAFLTPTSARSASTSSLPALPEGEGTRGALRDVGAAFELPITQAMPQRDGQAILVRNGAAGDMLSLPKDAALPEANFSVEAYVQLESYYEDAKVRVIASRWDGDHSHPGWALGVTGEKSKFHPHRLILQIVGKGGYEVVVSDFHLDLHKAYFVSACLNNTEGAEAGVTFYIKDVTDMDAPLKSAHVPCKPTGPLTSDASFVIGGRIQSGSSVTQGWDGLIDEVRVCKTALKTEQLLYSGGDASTLVAGYWQFEEHPGLLRDTAGIQKELRPLVPRPMVRGASKSSGGPSDEALVDFCHVLFNSNEFLYVD